MILVSIDGRDIDGGDLYLFAVRTFLAFVFFSPSPGVELRLERYLNARILLAKIHRPHSRARSEIKSSRRVTAVGVNR